MASRKRSLSGRKPQARPPMAPAPQKAGPKIIGYARVSTDDQRLDLQRDALRAAGCNQILEDSASGAKRDRPGLDEAIAALDRGDVLVVWRLDRLARSVPHLLDIVAELNRRGAELRSLTESLDTTTAAGELVFTVFAAIGAFERRLIMERTRAGMDAARRRGTHLGRRRVLTGPRLEHATKLLNDGASRRSVARLFQVGRATLDRAIPTRRASET
jgi:DNA invertase Pin-like site-specific DNA recombinase